MKVLDFGIAKGPGTPDSKRLTQAGSIIGTPEYMSPEQASSNVIDQRSDVYAFGVLAYETLTGRLPFDGDTPLATLMKHQSDAPVPPRRLRPELPPEVEQIVLRALVKRPEGRQQSMEELSAELSRLAAADLEVLRSPIFGTSVSPLLTGRATDRRDRPDKVVDRRAPRSSSRGETLPLGDTLPLRDFAPPLPEPVPTRPSTRVRRDTRSEVEVVSRRRSQVALAAVLGLLFLALLSGVVAALAVRGGGDGPAAASPTASADAPPRVEPAASRSRPRPPRPRRRRLRSPPRRRTTPLPPPRRPSRPRPKPARPKPARTPAGVGSKAGTGENVPSGERPPRPVRPDRAVTASLREATLTGLRLLLLAALLALPGAGAGADVPPAPPARPPARPPTPPPRPGPPTGGGPTSTGRGSTGRPSSSSRRPTG